MIYVIAYLLIVNAVSFFLMRLDKKKARRGERRIPERVLLGSAAIGGSIGALIAMHLYHHKLRHRQFRYGIPALILIQINIVALVYFSAT